MNAATLHRQQRVQRAFDSILVTFSSAPSIRDCFHRTLFLHSRDTFTFGRNNGIPALAQPKNKTFLCSCSRLYFMAAQHVSQTHFQFRQVGELMSLALSPRFNCFASSFQTQPRTLYSVAAVEFYRRGECNLNLSSMVTIYHAFLLLGA